MTQSGHDFSLIQINVYRPGKDFLCGAVNDILDAGGGRSLRRLPYCFASRIRQPMRKRPERSKELRLSQLRAVYDHCQWSWRVPRTK